MKFNGFLVLGLLVFLKPLSSYASFSSEGNQQLKDLDMQLVKERLHKTYGEFAFKAASEWKVGFDGKSQIWKLTEKGWVCPADAGLKCSDFTPSSIQWWMLGKGWLENWKPVARE